MTVEKKGTLTTYYHVIHYLFSTYATDDVVSDAKN